MKTLIAITLILFASTTLPAQEAAPTAPTVNSPAIGTTLLNDLPTEEEAEALLRKALMQHQMLGSRYPGYQQRFQDITAGTLKSLEDYFASTAKETAAAKPSVGAASPIQRVQSKKPVVEIHNGRLVVPQVACPEPVKSDLEIDLTSFTPEATRPEMAPEASESREQLARDALELADRLQRLAADLRN
ncbi:MAG: hypothetical protein KDA90_20865 [Planctomycetaceae bacterium]|nr:hypothetical protein [Planctomycetaceae bacterium]